MTVIVNTSNAAANWAVQAVDTLLPGCAITSIYQGAATTNNSAAATTLLRNRTGSSHEYVICDFDVAAIIAAIPAGEVVKNAYLRLHVNTYSGDFNDEYGVDHLSRAVVRAETTWNEFSAGNAWETPGALGAADISSAAIATIAYQAHNAPSPWMEWDISAFVKSRVDGVGGDSVIVRRLGTIDTDSYVSVTLDNQSGADGVRPELVVVTGAPVPAAFAGSIEDQKMALGGSDVLDISGFFSGDINGYSLAGAPAGTTINAVGLIDWDQSVAGSYDVTVTATGDNSADSNQFNVYIAPAVAITVDNATPVVGSPVVITSNTPLSGATVFGQAVSLTDQGNNTYSFVTPSPQSLSVDYGFAVEVEAADAYTRGTASIAIAADPEDFYFEINVDGGVPAGSIFSQAQNITTGMRCYARVSSGSVGSFTADGIAVNIQVSGQESSVVIEYDVFDPQTYTWVTGGVYNIPLTDQVDTERPVIHVTGGTDAITLGDTFVPPTVTVTDNSGADLSAQLQTTTSGSLDQAGVYTMTFSGPVDAAGNVANSVQWTCTISAPAGADPVRFVIDGDNTIIDLRGELLTHTFDHWFVTSENIDAVCKAGQALNVLAAGEDLAIVAGVGELQCAGPVVGSVYTLVAYSFAPGQAQPVQYRRIMLEAQAVV